MFYVVFSMCILQLNACVCVCTIKYICSGVMSMEFQDRKSMSKNALPCRQKQKDISKMQELQMCIIHLYYVKKKSLKVLHPTEKSIQRTEI